MTRRSHERKICPLPDFHVRAFALQPSPPMFSFTSWSYLATLAAYSHFPGQFSGEGKIMQAMQTHLGVGRNLEIQDLGGVFPKFIIVQLVNWLYQGLQ